MSGGLLRNGGRAARYLVVRHLRPSPLHGEISRPTSTRARAYVRSPPLSSKFKDSSPSLFAPSLSGSSPSARCGFVGWYLKMIEARPVLTKSLTAGAIFTAADISSQIITLASSDGLDVTRTLRMAGIGMFVSGPSLHFWFNFVSRILPKRDILSTFKKMALGQAIYGPVFNTVFFSINAGLQGETSAEIFARLKRDMIPTLKSGVMYWPPCDFMTFKFIPVHLQPLVSNSFSFIWTIYITYMANLERADIAKFSTE